LFNGKPKASASCRDEDAFGLPLNELGSRLTLSYPSQSGAVQLSDVSNSCLLFLRLLCLFMADQDFSGGMSRWP
jgi:hypothetical protein